MRRIVGQQPEQVEEVGRIGRRQILDPAEERRVAHFDGDEQHLVEREEHRDLQGDGKTAGDRVDLLLLVDLHHLLLLLHLVVGIALLQRGQLRLHRFHLRHRGVGLVGEREEQQLHQHRHQQDRDAEIADQVVEEVQRQEHRLGDEVEPAPVDQEIEVVEPELLVVAAETAERKIDADDAGFLGAGEQPRIGAAGAADRDGLRILQIVGLVGPDGADQIGREPRLQLRVGVGQQRRGPVFVGDAEPAVGDLEADRLGVVDLLVAVFLQALVAEIADQAFVQDVIAGDLRACRAARSARTDTA